MEPHDFIIVAASLLLALQILACFLFLRAYRRPIQGLSKTMAEHWTVERGPEMCERIDAATGGSALLRRAAVDAGVAAPLVGLLQYGDAAAQTAAAQLVARLSAADPQNQAKLGRSGCLEGCVALARSTYDATARDAAAHALEALVGPPSSVAASANKQRARHAGAVAVLQAIRDDATCSAEGRQAASAAIEHLAPTLRSRRARRLSGPSHHYWADANAAPAPPPPMAIPVAQPYYAQDLEYAAGWRQPGPGSYVTDRI